MLLPPFQIIRILAFSRYIALAMHLDYNMSRYRVKTIVSRKTKTSYNLEWREYFKMSLSA